MVGNCEEQPTGYQQFPTTDNSRIKTKTAPGQKLNIYCVPDWDYGVKLISIYKCKQFCTFLWAISALAVLRDWIHKDRASWDKPSNVSFWYRQKCRMINSCSAAHLDHRISSTYKYHHRWSTKTSRLTEIQRYSFERHTSVRLTVGYHIPCRSARAAGNSKIRKGHVLKVPAVFCNNIKVITTYLQVFSLLLQLAFPPCQHHLSAEMTTNMWNTSQRKRGLWARCNR